MKWRIIKIHQAEKNLPWPVFVAFAIITISICLFVWAYRNSASESMYSEVSKVIEEQQKLFGK